ncbi:M28 family peptidase [Algoriphagus sp. A40]|uniref:M28 family peptidase n=1 Tax=Algoriphagus sp. A40 TaxID=1945863 RepID=UPI0009868C23|nr:M28 family peptidase [Algoriphagus sp. A40]OOG72193.1 peptidase M28 [Algoriphagus sp. A40]
MNKSVLSLGLVLLSGSLAFSQKQEIEKNFNGKEAISEFTYLASDELMGRDPARPEMKLAYTFIADQLKKAGAMPVPGADGFYQNIPFRLSTPPKSGSVKLGGTEFTQGKNMLVLDGKSFSGTYEVVDLGFGMPEDFTGKDVKGKIVITNAGAPNKLSPNQLFSEGRAKTALAKEAGAIALIERFNIPSVPWQMVSGFLNRTQMSVDQGAASDLPYIWIEDVKNQMTGEKVKSAEVAVDGKVNSPVEGKNVIAWIEGTDPELKKEFIMLSAHYDHVGVGTPDAEGDSIFNGARDNAVGTVAVMNAAKFFAKNPPKRSILLALWTAEEKGLLGSGYFANNPLVPLNQIIYNLNIDNAGYNDTSIITVIGLGRTSADFMIEEAVADFGLTAKADPSPEQGLYDRSDNVNFARKGIPAPSFTLGFTAFDDKIQQYYHKAADEVESFDLKYAEIYWKSFILSAQKIANWSQKPTWVAGDKYEGVSKELYGDK